MARKSRSPGRLIGNGIQLGHDGVVVSERLLQPPPEPSSAGKSCSIELLRFCTGSMEVSDTILGFYAMSRVIRHTCWFASGWMDC